MYGVSQTPTGVFGTLLVECCDEVAAEEVVERRFEAIGFGLQPSDAAGESLADLGHAADSRVRLGGTEGGVGPVDRGVRVHGSYGVTRPASTSSAWRSWLRSRSRLSTSRRAAGEIV